ncbi:MAG: ATP-dependent helicase [Candidatus Thermoplasmatota archaeon]|nr:ATP-dependent helicase [Candidatus Thermoplasmatota archaeon]
MIIRGNNEYNLEMYLDPLVLEWFTSKYKNATTAQKIGIPLIHQRKNVLISSPTGTGKTLSGFLVTINELFLLAKENKLEDKIYCVYVSPLKALANDIHRNLEVPLEEIRQLAEEKGIHIPKIRVGVRSGDTSQYARQKMNKTPPHIFITTPESLALALFSPKFKEKFRGVEFLIIDEIHDLASNKRGELLSLIIEFLQHNTGTVTRIGLSATTEPIEELAKFLVGNVEKTDVHIVEAESNKNLDMRVVCPVSDLFSTPQEQINERTYDIIESMVKEHTTTLVFTNTRSGAERVSSKLIERGILDLEAHHSSLSKESRFNVEERLKKGELKCAVSSTSLELGIDIGSIDLVVQVGSPKGIAKGLQRVGRSGHSVFATAKGRIVPMDIDDLVESLVLVKEAKEKKLDRISIPKNSLDVLSQFVAGISLEKKWVENEALDLVRRSYCYKDLTESDFLNVINYLSGGFEEGNVYSKIWWDKKEHTFGRKKSTRLIYFTNAGTIPEEADYDAFSVDNRHLGSLSEKFVEKLHRGDIFVLGARTYEFLRLRGNKVFIKDASGRKPTVPSWVGEMLPRTFDLSNEVGKFRKSLEAKMREGTADEFLKTEYAADENSVRSVISYMTNQMDYGVPTNDNFLIEGYIDKANQFSVIFHFALGRRVNDALSRIIAFNISKEFSVNSRVSLTDDGFMLTFNRRVDIAKIHDLLQTLTIGGSLRNAVKSTELFKQRFRHCATRSFMVLRRYRGREVSVARQQLRSERVLDILFSMENFPIIEETFREIESIVMDLDNSEKILTSIRKGEIKINTRDYTRYPSPFGFGIISTGITDVVLMEDKSAIIRELQEALLAKMGLEGSSEVDIESLMNYQESKQLTGSEGGILEFLRKSGFADLYSTVSFSPLKKAEDQEAYFDELAGYLAEGDIVPVFTGKNTYALKENVPYLASVFMQESDIKINFNDGDSTNSIAKNNSMDPESTLIVLRKMERAYSAYFLRNGNRVKWYNRTVEKAERVESVRKVVQWLLWQNGPLTYNEIVDRIGQINELDEVMEDLTTRKIIVSGRFFPKRDKQYILSEDLKKLRSSDEIEIGKIRLNRTLEKMGENYFDSYLITSDSNSLVIRGYSEQEMNSKGIVHGHFAGTITGYFDEKYLPQLISLNRFESLSKEDKEILDLIKKGKYGMEDIEEKTLEKLIRNNYVVTKQGKPLKVNVDPEEPTELLERFVSTYGPISIEEIVHIFGGMVRKYIGKLNVKKMVSGHSTYLYTDLTFTKQKALISTKDPLFLINRERIEGETGEGMTYFLIEDGAIKLGFETATENGILEIFEITGDYAGNFDQVMEVVSEISKIEKFDSLVIRKITFPIPDKERMEIIGYSMVRNFMVNGTTVDDLSMDEEDMIHYLVKKHHLSNGYKHSDPVVALSSILGYKGNFELMMKSDRSIDLDKLVMSNLAVQGYLADGSQGYLSKENVSLIAAVKYNSLSDNSKRLYEIIKKMPSLSRELIVERSCFTINQTLNYLNEMMKKCIVYKDNKGRYQLTFIKGNSEEAMDRITKELGIFNGRILSSILGNTMNGNFISGYLSRGIEQGKFQRILPLKSRDEIMYSWRYESFSPPERGEDIVLLPRTLTMEHVSLILGWKPQGKMVLLRDGFDPIFFKGKRSGNKLSITTELRDETKKRISKYLLSINIKLERQESDEVTEKWYEQMIPKKYK